MKNSDTWKYCEGKMSTHKSSFEVAMKLPEKQRKNNDTLLIVTRRRPQFQTEGSICQQEGIIESLPIWPSGDKPVIGSSNGQGRSLHVLTWVYASCLSSCHIKVGRHFGLHGPWGHLLLGLSFCRFSFLFALPQDVFLSQSLLWLP